MSLNFDGIGKIVIANIYDDNGDVIKSFGICG